MKKILLTFGLVALLLVVAVIYPALNKSGPELKRSELKIIDTVFQVEIADTPTARERGLSGRQKLEDNQGMLFIFPMAGIYGFWMKDMKFQLDIIWIRDNKIIGAVLGAQPEAGDWPKVYNPPGLVDKVLEINGGLVQKLGIKVGDMLSFK